MATKFEIVSKRLELHWDDEAKTKEGAYNYYFAKVDPSMTLAEAGALGKAMAPYIAPYGKMHFGFAALITYSEPVEVG